MYIEILFNESLMITMMINQFAMIDRNFPVYVILFSSFFFYQVYNIQIAKVMNGY